MVGLVIVSHSARLAEGVVELAREMAGEEVAIEAAGGIDEPEGALGTDAARVMAAIERAGSGDGVLVLMDLGSAVMSAEMAVEMLDGGERIVLAAAPLVEGAVAAAAAARTGAGLDDVAAEARAALAAKAAHLGEEPAAPSAPAVEAAHDGPEARLPVTNALGLHARPAARFVATAGRFDADVTVANATTGAGPAAARSLMGIAALGVRQGHEVLVRASGRQAQEALDALRALADEGFGDGPGPAAAPAPAAREPAAPAAPAPAQAEPPAPGTRLRGLPGARGIAFGPARPLIAAAALAPALDETAADPEAEGRALDDALAAARDDLGRTRADVARRAGEAEAEIFDAHAALLEDAALLDPARAAIAGGRPAAAAWSAAARAAAERMAALDDPLLRERAADVRDVGDRVLGHLTGAGPAAATAEGVLVADELTPGQTAGLDPERVRGIATARGSATAHAAILARALGIPAVVGLGPALLAIPAGTPLVLDGDAGDLLVDPGDDVVAEHERRREAAGARRRRARERAREPAVTRDGVHVEVLANIGAADEVAGALELGAEGVGLLRTEFLFLDRDELPGVDEQVEVYRSMASALGDRPLVVRTLDVGADKPLRAVPHEAEANPFLGERGIRLALARPELLRTQLTAIARAAVAAGRPLSVMFPMVATLAELRAARTMLDEVRGDARLEVGIMVEVPAAALQANRLAAEVDFLSIGTNDLSQYTMAAERGNAAVAGLIDGPLPALLRLIAMTCDAARVHGARVAVCGELAGDPQAAALLAGLGVQELSMAPVLVPEAKEALRSVDLSAARAVALAALELDDAAAVRASAASLLRDG
ncbi:MAG: multiphosphoryl transfer protein [Solirubrobacteraceae bacterium]|nr:multiphosphoryl transfer protein [Solirubrobacteraceae bacterium]